MLHGVDYSFGLRP